jgi:hypothetical protein
MVRSVDGWRLQIYYMASQVNNLAATPQYSLVDNYIGAGFLSGFIHENIADPTHGRVSVYISSLTM